MGKTLLEVIEETVGEEVPPELQKRKVHIARAILSTLYNESKDRKSVSVEVYATKDVGEDIERIREFAKYLIEKMMVVLRLKNP